MHQDPRFVDDQLAYIRRMEREDFARRHPEWSEVSAPHELLDSAAQRAGERRFSGEPLTGFGALA